ncbi:unnamed protein product [Brassica oleracea]|uniref:(rape) hypothetical protein n=2 Tax=Brassica napus TaxID=3708 RepID=A0A816L408_BRANA|nr:unnamed protein product [Brassica napus]
MTWVNRESPREPYPINYCLTFFICSMKMSCLVSLTCSFAPFDTSLTRPTHFIIISSPIVNKVKQSPLLVVCNCCSVPVFVA